MAAGASEVVNSSGSWIATTGSYRFTFCADPPHPSGSVAETLDSAADNCFTSPAFTVNADNSWLQTQDGNVFSGGEVKLNASVPAGQNLAEYLVISGINIPAFTNAKNWLVSPYIDENPGPDNFADLLQRFGPGLSPSVINGNLPGNLGASSTHLYDGDVIWTGGYEGGACAPLSQQGRVVFIKGNLTLGNGGETDFAPNCPTVLIVQNEIRIHGEMRNIRAVLISNDRFLSVEDLLTQPINNQLHVFGGVISSLTSANEPVFDRNLATSIGNNNNPAERFVFKPEYLWLMKDLLGVSRSEYKEINP
jgi:hypothetical protein